jgi:PadR family transcriptional regulator, regulatory protein PadR
MEAAQFLPGTLYMLVLRTLTQGPLHGYAISKRIKEASDTCLTIEDGSLYPAPTLVGNPRERKYAN